MLGVLALLATGAVLFFGVRSWRGEFSGYWKPGLGDYTFALVIGTLFAALAVGVGAGVPTGIVYEVQRTTAPIESSLKTLADGQGVEGRFFLGSGSVDSEPVFFYYSGSDQDGYRLRHVDADYVTIHETDDEPKMVRYCEDNSTVSGWVTWPLKTYTGSRYDCYSDSETHFYVPRGSIQNNYILDAE
jgi:hypothetical protein